MNGDVSRAATALPVTEVKDHGWSGFCLEFGVVGAITVANDEVYRWCENALCDLVANGRQGFPRIGCEGSRLVGPVHLRMVRPTYESEFVLQVCLTREPTQAELNLMLARICDAGAAGVPGRDGLVTFVPEDFHLCRTHTTTVVLRHPVTLGATEAVVARNG